jgi:prepilin-type N-terminal cleavage/methylation domain-containing protein
MRSFLYAQCRRAFTLVELLVVIAIIGILIAMLLPAINMAREAGRRSQCKNNLKQCQLGVLGFHDAYKVFPPGRSGCDSLAANPPGICKSVGAKGLSGFVLILPFIEEKQLFDQFDKVNEPWDRAGTNENMDIPANIKFVATPVGTYHCPSDPVEPVHPGSDFITWGLTPNNKYAITSYGMNAGTIGGDGPVGNTLTNIPGAKTNNTGIFMYGSRFKAKQITDGLAKTMFLGEIRTDMTDLYHFMGTANLWTYGQRAVSNRTTDTPINTPYEGGYPIYLSTYGYITSGHFGSNHPGGAHFTFGDGRVIWIDDNIDLMTYQGFSTRALITYAAAMPNGRLTAGGEIVNEPK